MTPVIMLSKLVRLMGFEKLCLRLQGVDLDNYFARLRQIPVRDAIAGLEQWYTHDEAKRLVDIAHNGRTLADSAFLLGLMQQYRANKTH